MRGGHLALLTDAPRIPPSSHFVGRVHAKHGKSRRNDRNDSVDQSQSRARDLSIIRDNEA
jgi:hypothetical protein